VSGSRRNPLLFLSRFGGARTDSVIDTVEHIIPWLFEYRALYDDYPAYLKHSSKTPRKPVIAVVGEQAATATTATGSAPAVITEPSTLADAIGFALKQERILQHAAMSSATPLLVSGIAWIGVVSLVPVLTYTTGLEYGGPHHNR
jgi:hypothetical protein